MLPGASMPASDAHAALVVPHLHAQRVGLAAQALDPGGDVLVDAERAVQQRRLGVAHRGVSRECRRSCSARTKPASTAAASAPAASSVHTGSPGAKRAPAGGRSAAPGQAAMRSAAAPSSASARRAWTMRRPRAGPRGGAGSAPVTAGLQVGVQRAAAADVGVQRRTRARPRVHFERGLGHAVAPTMKSRLEPAQPVRRHQHGQRVLGLRQHRGPSSGPQTPANTNGCSPTSTVASGSAPAPPRGRRWRRSWPTPACRPVRAANRRRARRRGGA